MNTLLEIGWRMLQYALRFRTQSDGDSDSQSDLRHVMYSGDLLEIMLSEHGSGTNQIIFLGDSPDWMLRIIFGSINPAFSRQSNKSGDVLHFSSKAGFDSQSKFAV